MSLRLQPLVITLLCIFLPVLTFRTTYEGYFSLILKVMILILHQMEKPTLQVAANLVVTSLVSSYITSSGGLRGHQVRKSWSLNWRRFIFPFRCLDFPELRYFSLSPQLAAGFFIILGSPMVVCLLV